MYQYYGCITSITIFVIRVFTRLSSFSYPGFAFIFLKHGGPTVVGARLSQNIRQECTFPPQPTTLNAIEGYHRNMLRYTHNILPHLLKKELWETAQHTPNTDVRYQLLYCLTACAQSKSTIQRNIIICEIVKDYAVPYYTPTV